MALLEIANEDLLVNFDNQSPGVPPLAYLGDQPIDPVKVVPVKSLKSKALNKAVCLTTIVLTWTIATGGCPHTFAGHTFVAGGGAVTATAIKCKAEAQAVLRKDDTGTCAGSWTNNSSGATVTCACNVSISNAGQIKAKGQ